MLSSVSDDPKGAKRPSKPVKLMDTGEQSDANEVPPSRKVPGSSGTRGGVARVVGRASHSFGAAAYDRDHPRWNRPLEAVEADVERGWEMARSATRKPGTD
jgi:hypothetical protein